MKRQVVAVDRQLAQLLGNGILGIKWYSSAVCQNCVAAKDVNYEQLNSFNGRICPVCLAKDSVFKQEARGAAGILLDAGFKVKEIVCAVDITINNKLYFKITFTFENTYRSEFFEDLPDTFNVSADEIWRGITYTYACDADEVFSTQYKLVLDRRDAATSVLSAERNYKTVRLFEHIKNQLQEWSNHLDETGKIAVWRLAGYFETGEVY